MMKMLRKILVTLTTLVLLFTLASCGKAGGSYEGNGGAYADGGYTGGAESTDKDVVLDENRKIIKNVNESVQTDAYDDFMTSLNEAITHVGGYVSSSNFSGENYYNNDSLRRANLTVRIPAANLTEFVAKVESIAVVTSYSESVQDITEAYVDVESRIKVLEAEESALLAILSKSETTSDALEVRKLLLDVQSDLASLRAQKSSYDNRVEYSTVYLHVSEVRRANVQNPTFFEEVSANFSDSIYSIGEAFRAIAVWFLGDFLYIFIAVVLIGGVALLSKHLFAKVKSGKRECDTDDEKIDK